MIIKSLIFESVVKILKGLGSVEELIGVGKHSTIKSMLDLLTYMAVVALHFPSNNRRTTIWISSLIHIPCWSLSCFAHTLTTPSSTRMTPGKPKLLLLVIDESSEDYDEEDEKDEDAIDNGRLILFGSK